MRKLILVATMLFFASNAYAAGSVEKYASRKGPVQMISYYWTSDASGDVSGEGGIRVQGTIMQMHAVPESGVTDLYDLTLSYTFNVTVDGSKTTKTLADVISGNGANLSNSTDGQLIDLTSYVDGTITPVIANAGNATSGTIVFYIWTE